MTVLSRSGQNSPGFNKASYQVGDELAVCLSIYSPITSNFSLHSSATSRQLFRATAGRMVSCGCHCHGTRQYHQWWGWNCIEDLTVAPGGLTDRLETSCHVVDTRNILVFEPPSPVQLHGNINSPNGGYSEFICTERGCRCAGAW